MIANKGKIPKILKSFLFSLHDYSNPRKQYLLSPERVIKSMISLPKEWHLRHDDWKTSHDVPPWCNWNTSRSWWESQKTWPTSSSSCPRTLRGVLLPKIAEDWRLLWFLSILLPWYVLIKAFEPFVFAPLDPVMPLVGFWDGTSSLKLTRGSAEKKGRRS